MCKSTWLSISFMVLAGLSSGNLLAATANAEPSTDDLATNKVLVNSFQEMKNFLGLSIINEREYESRLSAVVPPYHELSATSGNYVLAAEDSPGMGNLQEFLMTRLLDWNMLQDEKSVKDSRLVEQHLLGFCSEPEADAKICNQGLTIQQGGAADLLIDTLLSNDTLTENQQISVWAYIDTLTNPTPLALPADAFYSETFDADALPTLADSPMSEHYSAVKIRPLSSDGIRTLAARYKQMAFLSTSQNALNQIAADRHVVKDLGNQVGMDKPDASIYEALKFEATRRYGDKNWHDQMYRGTTESLLRELNNMQAFQLALDFKRYEQEQTMTTLMAAQVAYFAQLMAQTEQGTIAHAATQ